MQFTRHQINGLFRCLHHLCVGALLVISLNINAASVNKNTIHLNDGYALTPLGAIRLQAGTHGSSRIAYTTGKIAISPNGKTLYAAGHAHHYSIGAFDISLYPPKFGDLSEIPIAPVIEDFTPVSPPHIPQSTANRIMGIHANRYELFVTVDEYYDANGDNNENIVIFDSVTELNKAKQLGYYPLQGRSHAAGWIGELPLSLGLELDATHYMGSSSGLPINSRLSMGPSLFLWQAPRICDAPPTDKELETKPLIDYSLRHPLHEDNYNKSGNNQVWTELSDVSVGFFAPNTHDYILIGRSGGHESGIGYKIKQDNGNVCGGPCAYKHDDYYNYFWIYKKEDIMASSRGDILPHELVPYSYGKLPDILGSSPIIGGDFNYITSTLYLMFSSADTLQSRYETQPVVVSFNVSNL